MKRRMGMLSAVIVASAAAAGCSSDGQFLSTASVASDAKVAAATPKFDPVCGALVSQIEGLRAEGSIDKLEKAADGKGKSVTVKRATLAKQAELNKVYADYQAKCGPQIPRAAQAASAAPAATAPASAAPATKTADAAPAAASAAAAPAR